MSIFICDGKRRDKDGKTKSLLVAQREVVSSSTCDNHDRSRRRKEVVPVVLKITKQ